MKHPIFRLMKAYHHHLDRSLSLKRQLTKVPEDSKEHDKMFHEMLREELECMELDTQIYWHYRTIKNNDTSGEYYNHLKTNQSDEQV